MRRNLPISLALQLAWSAAMMGAPVSLDLHSPVAAAVAADDFRDPAAADLKLRDFSSPFRGGVIELLDLGNADSVAKFVEARKRIPEAKAFAEGYARAFPGKETYHVDLIRNASATMKKKADAVIATGLASAERKKAEIDAGKDPFPQITWKMLRESCLRMLQLDESQPRCKEILAQADAVNSKAGAAENAKIDAARVPKAKVSGGKWTAVEEDVKKAYRQAWPEPIRKVLLKGDFETRLDRPNRVEYSDIGAWVVVDQSGKCRVFSMTFRKSRPQGSSAWGMLKYLSSGDTYLIRCENIDK